MRIDEGLVLTHVLLHHDPQTRSFGQNLFMDERRPRRELLLLLIVRLPVRAAIGELRNIHDLMRHSTAAAPAVDVLEHRAVHDPAIFKLAHRGAHLANELLVLPMNGRVCLCCVYGALETYVARMLLVTLKHSQFYITMSERRGPHDAVARDARAISAKTEDAWMRRQDETESTRPGDSTAEICVNRDEVGPENWRKELGRGVVQLQQAVDANLSLFRVGCVLVMAGSAYAAISLSGLLHRFNHIDEIPAYYFRQRKTLRVRMVRQCERDPSVFYVYHTPFWRRTLLQDTLPTDAWSTDRSQPLLAVRAFGIQVDESANEWLWSNVVSSHRYMSLRLLHRMNAEMEGEESLATCDVSIRKLPLDKDLAHELVSRGLAECIPETMSKYDDGSDASISSLMQRLQQLEATQRRAQTMQYGIWKDWQDEKLSDRMVSAGKRVTTRGFKKLMSKLSGED